jgi:L-alanine-DL-glutamate epimerase-like enolase superfamily enzyme
MKITGITATAIAGGSTGGNTGGSAGGKVGLAAAAQPAQRWCLLELATDAGLVGRGLCPAPAGDTALELARALLLGEDPRAVATLWDRLSEHADGDRAAPARASLDHACWDLKAQANGEPLWKTLGGTRPRAPVHASLRGAVASDATVSEWFGKVSAAHGFRGGCLRLSGDPASDTRRLALLREILERQGKPAELAADAGGTWPGETIRLVRAIERSVDLAWVRSAASHGDVLGCRRVADRIAAAVCVGGDLSCERDFLPWFQHRAGNVIELDIHRLGITGALCVAEAAFGFELPVTLSAAPGNIQVQLAAVMPNFMSAEVSDPTPAFAGLSSDIGFSGGRGTAGDRAGTGLAIDRAPAARGAGAKGQRP